MTRAPRFLTFTTLFIAALSACKEEDTTAPPAPRLDPVVSPTWLATQEIQGSAEYGASVTLTGGVSVVKTTADPFTARFRATVTLNNSAPGAATNLSVTATDADGNTSSPAKARIVFDPSVEPDTTPPSIAVIEINGFFVCPSSGLLTDRSDLSDCGTRIEPAVTFRRGSFIVAALRVRDNRSLVEVSYNAFGGATSSSDIMLVGAGGYTADTDLLVSFDFNVGGGAGGETAIVGQAIDADGNLANSAPAYVTVGVDIEAGDRSVAVLASGAILSNIRDAAVAPDGSVFVVNDDPDLPVIFALAGVNQTVSVYYDTFPVRPEAIAFDAAGNLYTTMGDNLLSGGGVDEIWQTTPAMVTSTYLPDQGGDPEGLAALAGGTPAHGYWAVTGTLPDSGCISIQIGAEPNPTVTRAHTYIVQASTLCVGGAPCAGGGVLSGLTPDTCLQWSAPGLSATQQRTEMATRLNNLAATTGMSAHLSSTCGNLPDPGLGRDCIVLVANEPGTTPAPVNALPVALESTSGNWIPHDIARGDEDGTLYVANRGSDEIHVVQLPPAASAGVLRSYDFNQGGWANGGMQDLAAALRRAAGDPAAQPERLFLFISENNTDEIIAFDASADSAWILADPGSQFPHLAGGPNSDQLSQPWGVAYVPGDVGGGGDCLLVANRATGGVLFQGEVLAYVDLDNRAGAALEGNLPIITGFDRILGLALDTTNASPANWSLIVVDEGSQLVARVGRSAATTDCF